MNRIQLRRSQWATALVALALAVVPGCKGVPAAQAPAPPTVPVAQEF
jgi:hypothetical protein